MTDWKKTFLTLVLVYTSAGGFVSIVMAAYYFFVNDNVLWFEWSVIGLLSGILATIIAGMRGYELSSVRKL